MGLFVFRLEFFFVGQWTDLAMSKDSLLPFDCCWCCETMLSKARVTNANDRTMIEIYTIKASRGSSNDNVSFGLEAEVIFHVRVEEKIYKQNEWEVCV